MVLSEEMKTYRARLPDLLASSNGKFVLIRGSRVVDTFVSIDDALLAGYDAFGNSPFLIKQVQPVDAPGDLNLLHGGG